MVPSVTRTKTRIVYPTNSIRRFWCLCGRNVRVVDCILREPLCLPAAYLCFVPQNIVAMQLQLRPQTTCVGRPGRNSLGASLRPAARFFVVRSSYTQYARPAAGNTRLSKDVLVKDPDLAEVCQYLKMGPLATTTCTCTAESVHGLPCRHHQQILPGLLGRA